MNKLLFLIVFILITSAGYSQTAEDYVGKGKKKAKEGNYKEAKTDFTKAIEINPEYVKAYYYRGTARLNKLKDYRSAIADFTKAIEIDPEFVKAYNNRGITKAKLDNYRDAISDFSKAIEINPQAVRVHINRGNAKFELENYKDAIADYSKAIEKKPKNIDAYFNQGYAEAYYKRGLAGIHSGKTDSSCPDLRKAKELDYDKADEKIQKHCN